MDFKNIIKYKHLDRILFLLVLVSSIFVAFYKILDIPPGVQYDQLRAVLVPEIIAKGISNNFGIRQFVAFYILNGYWAYYLVDLFRTTLSVDGMIIAGRIPSALFFIMSSVVWWKILVELRRPLVERLIFFLIFIPSGYSIVFSHYIPLIAGYLFFSSASILAFIKFLNSKKTDIIYLYIGIILAVLSTYTHGMSVFFIPVFYGSFLTLLILLKRDLVKKHLKKILNSKLATSVSILLILGSIALVLYPLVEGYLGKDQSIQVRYTFSVVYLIQEGEIDLIFKTYFQKLGAYISPNSLVTGTSIDNGAQPLSNILWFQIKNPKYNQWWITNLGPFGFITLSLYFGGLYLLYKTFKKKDMSQILALSLFLSYLLLPFFPNFDNPSIAKTIPALMFIPLSLSLLSTLGSNFFTKHKKHFYYGILIFLAINIFISFTYLYSESYQKSEAEKFEYNYPAAVQYIAQNANYQHLRIGFHDELWNNTTMIEYFLSPYILNRVTWINESAILTTDSFDLTEDNFILTKYPQDIETVRSTGVPYKVQEFNAPAGEQDLYVIELKPEQYEPSIRNVENTVTASVTRNASGKIVCLNQPYSPQFKGDYEVIKPSYRYYDTSQTQSLFTINDCEIPSRQQVYLLDPYNVKLNGNELSSQPPNADLHFEEQEFSLSEATDILDIKLSPEGKSTFLFKSTRNLSEKLNIEGINAYLVDDTWKFIASEELSLIRFDLPLEKVEGTYYIEFDFTRSERGDADITITDNFTRQIIPIPSMRDYLKGNHNTYSTVFSLYDSASPEFTIVLGHNSPLLDRATKPAQMELSNLKLIKLSGSNILSSFPYNAETVGQMQGTDLLNETLVFSSSSIGNLESNNINQAEDSLILFNIPFNPNFRLKDGLNEIAEPVMINGWLQGFYFRDSYKGSVTVVNSSYGYLVLVTIASVLLYTLIMIPLLIPQQDLDTSQVNQPPL
ncbi:hypothetical protein H6764_01410 [Candidatus Nomurabacteria bacterium]|nr:hypothetical protein [Candidatus Nomurabacteria bacterium]